MNYLLIVFIPESHFEAVRDAILEAGAGAGEHYDQACWWTSGTGQFRPLAGSQPFVGETGTIHREREIRLETVVSEARCEAVITALRQAHPYEEPAFSLLANQA